MPHCYSYPRPAFTADCLIFAYHEGSLQLLLIQRKHEPFQNYWALPGGFVDENEEVEQAAQRELFEECGLKNIDLQQLHTFSKAGRDPRGWTITTAFWGLTRLEYCTIKAGDDAQKAHFFPITTLPLLAFDHKDIFHMALSALKQYLTQEHQKLTPLFSPSELQEIKKILSLSSSI